jgi:aspartyl/asparaginyl-tRNA synthetase
LITLSVGVVNSEAQGESFWVRGHLQTIRAKSKLAFLTIRQGNFTIQAILTEVSLISPFYINMTLLINYDDRATKCLVL